MKEINNLIYTLEINFVSNSGVDSSVSVKFDDGGLKVKCVKICDVCITEERKRKKQKQDDMKM